MDEQTAEKANQQRAVREQAEEKIQWHQGFCGVIEWDLRTCKQDLTFETEHELSKKPLRVDMLIVKKNKDIELKASYARAFRQFNVIEYKSPEDGLTIDDFYKAIGYAMLYKGLGETVNAIPADKLTVSLFRHGKPRELFRCLSEEAGVSVERRYPGVYAVSGYHIPVQIVVTKELAKEERSALRLLTYKVDEEETVRFLRDMERLTDPGDRNNARAALEVIVAANLPLFQRLRREGNMEQVMRVVFGDDWDRRWNEGVEQGRRETRKEYEAVLADKDRSLAEQRRSLAEQRRSLADKDRILEEMAQELRELKARYGLA